MIIQDTVQILVAGPMRLGALWGVLDPPNKGELWVTLHAVLEITVIGWQRFCSQAVYINNINKGDFKRSLNQKKGMALKTQNSIHLSQCDSSQRDAGTLHFTYYISLFIQTVISREFSLSPEANVNLIIRKVK